MKQFTNEEKQWRRMLGKKGNLPGHGYMSERQKPLITVFVRTEI